MAISDRIQAMYTHTSDIYDSVELTGVDTTDIDKNLVNVPNTLKEGYIDIINNGTDTLYNNFPKVSGEGTSLTLNNTYQAPMRNNLKGNTSQTGTPTPTSPIPVNVVSGDNEINVVGKNLFSTTVIQGAIDTNTVATSTIRLRTNDFIKVQPSTTYMCSFSGNAKDYDVHCFTTNAFPRASELGWKTNTSFTTPSNCNYIMITFRKSDNSTITPSDISNIQLEKNSSASTYEPYQGNTYNIDLPEGIELCKIGNYQDYFYKEDDKWYLHKEIGKVVLNGSETWILQSTKTSGYNRFRVKVGDNLVNTSSSNVLPMYCDKLSAISPDGTFLMTQGIASDSNVNHYFNVYIEEVNTYNLTKFKNWLATNNLEVYYILATLTNEEITYQPLIDQLNLLEKAISYENQTNISQVNNDLPFIISSSALKKG